MQLVLKCQDSTHCSSGARYGSEESHKRHPWNYLKNKESLSKQGCWLSWLSWGEQSMPAEAPQMEALHNSLAGRLVDVSLVTEHPFSTAVGREGRREGRRMETVTSSICPWVYLHIFKQLPACKLRPSEISLKARVIVLIILLLVKCSLEAVLLQMLASKWFIMLCILLFIAECLLLGNPFLDCVQIQTRDYDFSFSFVKLVLVFKIFL